MNFIWLALAFSLHSVGLFLSACRWRLLLKAQEMNGSVRALASSYMVGFFFNTFLPTTVGGDISRAYDTSRRGHLMGDSGGSREFRTQKSIAVIIVERSGGIASLIFLAIVASLFGGRIFKGVVSLWLVLVLFLFLVLLAVLVLSSSVNSLLGRFFRAPVFSRLGNKLVALLDAVSVYRDRKKPLFMALLFSLGLQINTVFHYYLIARGLGLEIPLIYFFAIVPLAVLILLLPVSINGIGVRENVYVFFLGQLGVGMAASIALSWISFALVLIFAVAGGVIYVVRK